MKFAAILLAAASLSGQTSAAAAIIPPALQGEWVITAIQGDDPGLLEVDKASDLIGKHVTISDSHLALWTVYGGKPTMVVEQTGTLVSTQPSLAGSRDNKDFLAAHAEMEFYRIGVSNCTNDSRSMQTCIPVIFARDANSGVVSLVTVPWGMATLHRVGPPANAPLTR